MLMTGNWNIQDVILFPQMRPEKVERRDKEEAFTALGVPAEWVAALQKTGILTVEALAAVERPGKVMQDLLELNKRYKLGYKVPTVDDIAGWVSAARAR